MATVEIKLCNYSNPAHLQAVTILIDAYIKDEMGGGKPLSKSEQLRLVDGLNSHPKAIVLLAETNNAFVGLLTAFENFSTFTAKPMINIHDVFILQEYRGKGIGRQLMNAVISEAESRKCTRITLEVRDDNVKAQSLYKSLGFDETDPRLFYWRKNLNAE
jgi:ribosomal protein S18 acetylase RimI-like enzyme